ncbi:MAG: L-aspartate oxidase [Verrucomicrobiales bacterium]
MKKYDFLVVGSGIAGLVFALKAACRGSVAVVTKRRGEDSNTAQAQGGIACAVSPEDSLELHIGDTLDAGAGLCNEEVVRAIVSEAPERIRELIELGVHFDERENGKGELDWDLGREGGHSRRRILHSRDTTGREIEDRLLVAVREHPDIELLEHHFAVDLITTAKLGLATQDRCIGLYAFDQKRSEVTALRADRVILATGGCGKVYLYTTNPDVATGDGVAMAWRAGAAISNMEFVQFHPTCLYHPSARSFLISEAVRGEGGVLVDGQGNEFMAQYDERESLAPRDIVARAIDREIKKRGSKCVYVDISHKSRDFIQNRFPNIFEVCASYGLDISEEPIPVVPAAHYQCGGVRTDINGASSLRGLYAVGEVACSGMHGANRLASNSLLEGLVMAHRASEDIVLQIPLTSGGMQDFALPQWVSGDVQDVDELVVVYHNWDEIRRLMWDYVSIVRTGKRLRRAATRLRNLQREIQEFYWNFKITSDVLELRNLVEVAALIVDSAARRKESRGLHFTLDNPQRDSSSSAEDTVLYRF